MDPVIVAMATFPPRRQGMVEVVNALLPQCDKFYLYLNGYTEVPEELPKSDKLVCVCAGPGCEHADIGSQGKFFWVGRDEGYYLTVDDDIHYPEDYVKYMVACVDKYGRKAIVGLHGYIFRLNGSSKLPQSSLRGCRALYCYDKKLGQDLPVHVLGAGVMACYPKAIGLTFEACEGPVHSGDDEDIAIWGQRNDIALVKLATEKDWVRPNPAMWVRDALQHRADYIKSSEAKLRAWTGWAVRKPPAPVAITRAPPPPPRRSSTVTRDPARHMAEIRAQRLAVVRAARLQALAQKQRRRQPVPRPNPVTGARRTPAATPARSGMTVKAPDFTGWGQKTHFKASAPVTIAMATFPPRKEGMLIVVNELLPQCDRLCVYLNGYTEVPPELPVSDKLVVVLAGPGCEAPDLGSQGKHYWLDMYNDGYYLTVDDDIFYPPDYVARMIAAIDKYDGSAIVTCHGHKYNLDAQGRIPADGSSRQYRTACAYWSEHKEDQMLHIPGNGCTGYRPAAIGLDRTVTQGPLHSGDDDDFAVWAQAHKVPVIRMATPAKWLRANDAVWPIEAQHLSRTCTSLQDAKIRSWTAPWRLFPVRVRLCTTAEPAEPAILTVSMPTFNTPPRCLRRAVESVLAQTETRLRLVVVNDGGMPCWDALAGINDPRLSGVQMPANVGAYACHAETLQRCTTPWWSPHDSDDWTTPDRYACLLDVADSADVVLGGYTTVTSDGVKTAQPPLKTPRDWGGVKCASVWAGSLWSTSWVTAAGGINGSFRVGYDSALQSLAWSFGRVKTLAHTGYMYEQRPQSLTWDPKTGMGSAYRARIRTQLIDVLAQAISTQSLTGAGAVMSRVRCDCGQSPQP